MCGNVLILGASGRFGQSARAAFEAAGWTVIPFRRGRDDLQALASRADVVVNGWNPAYPDWEGTVPQMTDAVVEAVHGTAATVLVPGNVYVFGARTPAPWGPETRHGAENSLGLIRRRMENRYREAGIRTIILRGGDFLDTRASGNWFDRVLIRSLERGVLTYPGRTDVPHAWAYLPDMARAAVQLAEMRHDLPAFSDIPFPGYTASGAEMASALGRALGAQVRPKRMSWTPIRLAAPVWPMGRKLLEMRYLWDVPHWLDGSVFETLLPGFAHTPLEKALAAAVQGAGVSSRSTQTSRWRLARRTVS